ncbi:MAG: urease accessory protein UreF [Gemmobacter sp.]
MTAPLRDLTGAGIDTAALLTLVQWLSPAFPVGAFAYSHGMETAIAAGELSDGAAVAGWVADVLDLGSGRADAVQLAHALQPGADHAALADLARALATTSERLRETEEIGAALTRAINALAGTDHGPLPFPVALGRAAAPLGLPVALVIAVAVQAFAANLVNVAVRFVPLGQTEGQHILARLRPLILRLAEDAAVTPLTGIATTALRADIASARHETLTTRIFRT